MIVSLIEICILTSVWSTNKTGIDFLTPGKMAKHFLIVFCDNGALFISFTLSISE